MVDHRHLNSVLIRFTYPKILPTPGGTRYRQTGTATIAQTTFYSWSLPRVCVHAQAGSRNGLAHALQDSIVGSDSGTPKLPRSTLPVLRSTVPVYSTFIHVRTAS